MFLGAVCAAEANMKIYLNRRQLFTLIGMVATAGCRKTAGVPDRQQPTESTVTLTVDGML